MYHGDRSTKHIRPRSTSKYFKAAKFSEGRAEQPNLYVTINLAHTECRPEMASSVMRVIYAKFGRWLRYQSKKDKQRGGAGYGPPTYLAVIENPKDIHHGHWTVYVPKALQDLFKATLPTWIIKTAGKIIKAEGLVDIQPVETIMALSRYCMKGVDPRHARRCFVKPKPQGVVVGLRTAVSRSLSAAARLKASGSAAAGPAVTPYVPASKPFPASDSELPW